MCEKCEKVGKKSAEVETLVANHYSHTSVNDNHNSWQNF